MGCDPTTSLFCLFFVLQVILAADVHSLSSNCFYLPNMSLNGGTYDEFPAAEIKFCCMACAHDPCCIAYTFDKQRSRCYMKSAISDSHKTSSMTSGIKANTHSGQGALLKNIKIHGGMASAVVNLPNSEDCMHVWHLLLLPIASSPHNNDFGDR